MLVKMNETDDVGRRERNGEMSYGRLLLSAGDRRR